MGRIPGLAAHRADTIVFASETCAFDLVGANYEREVKPGELVIVGAEGVHPPPHQQRDRHGARDGEHPPRRVLERVHHDQRYRDLR